MSASKGKNSLVIVDGVRTPFTKLNTDLARSGAVELGRTAVNALLTRTGIDPDLRQVQVHRVNANPVVDEYCALVPRNPATLAQW